MMDGGAPIAAFDFDRSRPSTSSGRGGMPRVDGNSPLDGLHRSQLQVTPHNRTRRLYPHLTPRDLVHAQLAAALLETAASGGELTTAQRAEVCHPVLSVTAVSAD